MCIDNILMCNVKMFVPLFAIYNWKHNIKEFMILTNTVQLNLNSNTVHYMIINTQGTTIGISCYWVSIWRWMSPVVLIFVNKYFHWDATNPDSPVEANKEQFPVVPNLFHSPLSSRQSRHIYRIWYRIRTHVCGQNKIVSFDTGTFYVKQRRMTKLPLQLLY